MWLERRGRGRVPSRPLHPTELERATPPVRAANGRPHPQGVVIHPDAVLGPNCLVLQQVTIGTGPTPGVPTLGGHVDVGAGARISSWLIERARSARSRQIITPAEACNVDSDCVERPYGHCEWSSYEDVTYCEYGCVTNAD